MPGPSEFVAKVTDATRNARAVVLSLTEYPPNGLWHAVRMGLRDANIFEPIELTIYDGMNVPAEIGTHFSLPSLSAEALAHHRYGYQHAVILKAAGKRAQQQCNEYVMAFLSAIGGAIGDVRLIIAIQDGENTQDIVGEAIRVIAFSGMLTSDEMEAYITQRMVLARGPGSTRLLRHLVTEYAGFDPQLAEQLIAMDPSRIYDLPDSLAPLLGTNLLRWSAHSWAAGTVTAAFTEIHPLREWYVATHAGTEAAKYRQSSEKRYWRACLKALIPWMEERRPRILEMLTNPISDLERAHGDNGYIMKKLGNRTVQVTREELEYNDLAFFFKQGFGITTSMEQAAVSVCRKAKIVRDELAHLRPPKPSDIVALVSDMDALMSATP
ncbi:hypothetical protein AT959_15090 [Dechloromonas denitrificans]|uniref:Uncharacterized protein n=2 Tax=Dechloromonas denitrificans TaxID=281362 RepID=A0A133XEE8_9RHOO|nr:hypothetical protein AT959_15090 [Dechloromonas denitrificans]